MRHTTSKRFLMTGLIATLVAGSAAAHTQVRLTGVLGSEFAERPAVSEVVEAFSVAGAEGAAPVLWGAGWEVIINRIGLGADYLVNFHELEDGSRWLDWYGHGLMVSYHPFGAGAFLDPFVSFGIGNAGRLNMDEVSPATLDELYLSIFPLVTAGIALDFDGFIVSSRLSFTPTLSPPQGTEFQNYPLERFQVTVAMGVGLGGH